MIKNVGVTLIFVTVILYPIFFEFLISIRFFGGIQWMVPLQIYYAPAYILFGNFSSLFTKSSDLGFTPTAFGAEVSILINIVIVISLHNLFAKLSKRKFFKNNVDFEY